MGKKRSRTGSRPTMSAPTTEVRVPDIGDFTDVPVIEIHVSPGDEVSSEDPLVTLESDKATMDVPAPLAGTVKQLQVKIGDRVSEGSVLLTLETDSAGAATPDAPGPAEAPAPTGAPGPSAAPSHDAPESGAPAGDGGTTARLVEEPPPASPDAGGHHAQLVVLAPALGGST